VQAGFGVTGSPSRTGGGAEPGADVMASEVASYAYCAKAWHLRHVLGQEPSRQAASRQAAGVLAHELHGERVKTLAWLERRGRAWVAGLLLLAAALLAFALLLPRLGAGGK